jgi:hypothetical protein
MQGISRPVEKLQTFKGMGLVLQITMVLFILLVMILERAS